MQGMAGLLQLANGTLGGILRHHDHTDILGQRLTDAGCSHKGGTLPPSQPQKAVEPVGRHFLQRQPQLIDRQRLRGSRAMPSATHPTPPA
jgi:hypothetical protein